jgi:hypothetical protein
MMALESVLEVKRCIHFASVSAPNPLEIASLTALHTCSKAPHMHASLKVAFDFAALGNLLSHPF